MLQADVPVVVDFWAPWCGPCRVVDPILSDMADEHGERVKFVKVNVDENPQTQARYSVLSIPTVILFEAGEAGTASSAPAPAATTRARGNAGSGRRPERVPAGEAGRLHTRALRAGADDREAELLGVLGRHAASSS